MVFLKCIDEMYSKVKFTFLSCLEGGMLILELLTNWRWKKKNYKALSAHSLRKGDVLIFQTSKALL